MTTFLKKYNTDIEKNLQTIDLWLRTETPPFCPKSTGTLLGISTEEVLIIMKNKTIDTLNHFTFFLVMESGSSTLCGYFSRQLECGFPTYYTIAQISYIYNLDYFAVEKAAETMAVTLFSTAMLKPLFSQIQLP